MRLIDADELCDDVDNYEFTEHSDYSNVRDMIDYAPTIDAEPVKHSHWEKSKILSLRQCHTCGHFEGYNANYCANCGAKMDGGESE